MEAPVEADAHRPRSEGVASSVAPRRSELFLGVRTSLAIVSGIRACLTILAAWTAALYVEAAVVALGFRSLFAGTWETALARNVVLPLTLLAAAPLAPLVAALFALARKAETSAGARTAVAGLAGLAGALGGYGVSFGRHFASWLVRGPFVVVLGLAAAGLVYVLAPAVARASRGRPGMAAVAFGAATVTFWLADAFVLPRLYPAFHAMALAGAALGAAGVVLVLPRTRWLPWVGAVALALSAFAGPRGLPRLSLADNTRLVLVEHAPWLGRGVAVAMTLRPPEEDVHEGGAQPVAAGARALDWTGSDIVLLTVDALRADHVSAYGYPRKTTPALDALAAEGALFEAAYCPTPHTSYSVTSLMTGKYMRPLLALGRGDDSDTLAGLLRRYGRKTAGFYPPAVFFIDEQRFARFEGRGLDFEYRKVEFADPDLRRRQVERYLAEAPEGKSLFMWVHFFEPHEPYVMHEAHPFGDPRRPRPSDAYDSEIAAADAGIGAIVALVRARRPHAVFVVTADHGEEFGEHGGRYHGTSVYEEQVRVPLVVSGPGVEPRRVSTVVQTIDVLPTILSALAIPRPPRIRGRDLGPLLAKGGDPAGRDAGAADGKQDGGGFAFAEAEGYALIAQGPFRLVCERRSAACALYRTDRDPTEQHDIGPEEPATFRELKGLLAKTTREHGRYEPAPQGERPEALRRAAQGDGEAALDVATLLDDAQPAFREEAAALCYELHRPETIPALRRALGSSDDPVVRRWASLALVRAGDAPSPAAEQLLTDADVAWRRRAALAFAERGDPRGGADLLDAWEEGLAAGSSRSFEEAREVLLALAKIRYRAAAPILVRSLDDVRLRPAIAETLGALGDPSVRPPLLRAFAGERYMHARPVEARALVALGAREELAGPLARFAGVPDGLDGALRFAETAGLLVPRHGGAMAPAGRAAVNADVHVGAAPRGLRILVDGAPADAGRAEGQRADASNEATPRVTVEGVTVPLARSGDDWVGEWDEPFVGGSVRVTAQDARAVWVVPRTEELPPPPKEPFSSAPSLETSGAP